MRNLVVDIKDSYAVVLTDSGDYMRITNTNNLAIGDVYLQKLKRTFPRLMKIVSSIAAVFILGFMASFFYLTYTPVSFVEIRINPGITMTLNKMNQVISIKGINDDGKLLLENMAKESDPQKALDLILSKAVDMGFFTEGNPVRITVAMKNSEEIATMQTALMATAQNTLKSNSIDVPVSAFSIDVEDFKKLESTREIDETDTTDYSSEWKEKAIKATICDVKFDGDQIIIEFNHNLTLDNAKVFAYSEQKPTQKMEAKIIALKNDKLTVSFDSLISETMYTLEVTGITNKEGVLLDAITAMITKPLKGKQGLVKPNTSDTDNTDNTDKKDKQNNGSVNGNYRNEDDKGNGNANGLQKQDRDEDKQNGKDKDDDDDADDNEKDKDDTDNLSDIDVITYQDGQIWISFKRQLSFTKALVEATPQGQGEKIIGQMITFDTTKMVISFPYLIENKQYTIQIQNVYQPDGVLLDPIRVEFKMPKETGNTNGKEDHDDETSSDKEKNNEGKGNSNNNK